MGISYTELQIIANQINSKIYNQKRNGSDMTDDGDFN